MPKRDTRITFILLAVLILSLFLSILNNSGTNSYNELKKCNNTERHIRMFCYKNFIKSKLENENTNIKDLIPNSFPYIRYNSLSEVTSLYQNSHGTNTHTFLHMAGDVFAKKYVNNLSEGLLLCDGCVGYQMAVLIRMAYFYNYDELKVNQLIESCLKIVSYKIECTHAAGHIFFDKFVFNTLKLFDDFQEGKLYRLNEPSMVNLSSAFSACENLSEGAPVCNIGVAHNIFHLIHYTDDQWENGITWCNQIRNDEYKQTCLESFALISGGNEAGLELIKGNTNQAISFCIDLFSKSGENVTKECFKGIGIEIADVIASLNVDDFKLLKDDFSYLASLCKKIGKYSGYCYNGMNDYIARHKRHKHPNILVLIEFEKYLPKQYT